MKNSSMQIVFTSMLVFAVLWTAHPGLAQDSQEKRDFVYGEKLYNEGLFDLAAIQFQRFIRDFPSSPQSAEAQFLIAESQFAVGRFESAREAYLKTILNYPPFPQLDKAQFRMAECFEKESKISEALESYFRVYVYYPKSKIVGESLYRCARLAAEINRFEKAESAIQLLLERVPSGETHSKALFLLSDVYSAQEEFERAVAVLNPLRLRPIQEKDAAKALLMTGLIYESQGRFEESMTQYEKAATSLKNPDIQALAEYHRGVLLQMEGKDQDASAAYQKALAGLTDDGIKSTCFRAEADMAFQRGQFQAALDKFDQMSAGGGGNNESIRLEKIQCYKKLNRLAEAEHLLQSIRNDSSDADGVKKSLLFLADICMQTHRFERAVSLYRQYVNRYPDDALADAVLFQKANVYLDSLDLFEDAMVVFQKLRENYPDSPFGPQSHFLIAEKLNRLGRFAEARRLYQYVNDRYPGIAWADQSAQRFTEIEWLNEIHLQKGFAELSRYFVDRDSSDYPLGKMLFQDFKQFRDAIRCFQKFLALNPPSAVRVDTALFFMGACYEAAAKKENQPALLDSARVQHRAVFLRFPESPLAASAWFRTVLLAKELQKSDRLKQFLDDKNRYGGLRENDFFLFTVGKTAQECDSIGEARIHFQELVRRFPQSPYAEEAMFQDAVLSGRKNNFETDSLFSVYRKTYPNGRFVPWILFHQSRIRLDGAIPFLEELDQRFPCTSWADSARALLGDLYLETKNYSKAMDLFQREIREDSLAVFAESVGIRTPFSRQKKNILFKLAKTYEGLGQFKKAKQLYFQCGRTALAPEERAVLYSALSRISEKEGNSPQAAAYLGLAVQLVPSDSTFQTLGQFHFRLEQYPEAVSAWSRALDLTPRYSTKAFLKSRMLIAEMRQDQTDPMETKIKEFQKTFGNDPNAKEYSAELYLELAKACTRQKEFDLALKWLKEVQKNKNSAFYPESEAETGKVLLITNKIEKALELLTDMPRRYPGNPVLSKVYLNLGDHYFRSQQFENAITAFKKVSADSSDPTLVAVAMRYLIKIYDALQMSDAALATTRKYIRRFPKAEDVLEKRIQIGIFCANLKEYFLALDAFREVQKDATDETDAEIQYWIGKCYYEMGQFEEAILEFLKVKYVSKPTRLPWAATALYEAGTSYTKLKDSVHARAMFQKIVTTEGADSDLGRIAVKRIQEIDSGN